MENISRILNSSADDRYKHFIKTIIEKQEVWFLEFEDAYTMFKNEEGGVDLLVWQDKKMAEDYAVEGEIPVSISFEEFCDQCKAYVGSKEVMLMVCPTEDKDVIIVNMEQMLNDIERKISNGKS